MLTEEIQLLGLMPQEQNILTSCAAVANVMKAQGIAKAAAKAGTCPRFVEFDRHGCRH